MIWPTNRGAIENDDAIVVRATGKLNDVTFDLAASSSPIARAFDEHFDASADERLVVLLADSVLQRQQLVVAAVLDVVRHVVGIQLRPFVPGRSLYLKMKLFLKRAFADQVAPSAESRRRSRRRSRR